MEYILNLKESERKFTVKAYRIFNRKDGKIIGHLGGFLSGRKTAIRILRVNPNSNWEQFVRKTITVPETIREFKRKENNGYARYVSPIGKGEFKLNDLQLE